MCTKRCPFLDTKDLASFCWNSNSLLERKDCSPEEQESRNMLNCYTLGEITPVSVANYISHNNHFHGGDTETQLEYLRKLLPQRAALPQVRAHSVTERLLVIPHDDADDLIKKIREQLAHSDQIAARSLEVLPQQKKYVKLMQSLFKDASKKNETARNKAKKRKQEAIKKFHLEQDEGQAKERRRRIKKMLEGKMEKTDEKLPVLVCSEESDDLEKMLVME